MIIKKELYHHGVQGMKWGRRKQRVLIGRKQSSDRQKEKNKKWSTKKKIAVGSAIVGSTALAAIGGYTLYKNKKFKSSMKNMQRQNEALKSLEKAGREALSRSSFYSQENEFGKVIARRTGSGTIVSLFGKDGAERLTW